MKRLFLAVAVIAGVAGGINTEMSYADETIYISDAEDMEKLRENPTGIFELTNDIDMSGVDWTPVTFSGTLNGFGYSILNLTVNRTGNSTRDVYAANMTTVNSAFAGVFDVLDGATVCNVSLYGLNIDVESDANIFVGGLAGYVNNVNIVNCSIDGSVKLTTGGRFFGTGGVVGFSSAGVINSCSTDVTIISVDTDSVQGNEQFLGGVFAAGYGTVTDCRLNTVAYDSNHGYVHNGGIAGQYNLFPADNQFYGRIKNNTNNFSISYFEDISEGRDHCGYAIGEMVSTYFEYAENADDFNKDKREDINTILLPHACESPEFSEERVGNDCTAFSYTVYTCKKCGYSYKGRYELKKHSFAPGEVMKEATDTEEGLVKLTCTKCDGLVYLNIPVGSVWTDETTEETGSEDITTEEETTEEKTTAVEIETTAKPIEKESKTEPVEIVTAEALPASPESKATENRTGSGADIGFFIIILIIVCIPAVGILVYRMVRKNSRRRKRKK